MSSDMNREDLIPPLSTSLDEGYWSALLNEGEYSGSAGEPSEIDNSEDDSRDYRTSLAYERPLSNPTDDWDEIEDIMRQDQTLELHVVGHNRGGLLVEWHSLRGFVPASQLVDQSSQSARPQRLHLDDYLGQALLLRVIELDRSKSRLILSERAARAHSGARAEILRSLRANDTVEGIVTNLCEFGAFVDLGGVEGLIHISELSWGRVGHPEDVLKRDQHVRVFVLDVDPTQARIALSLKRLYPDPWLTVADRYKIGEIVEGKITNVVDFGAFACIEEGLEGLIHFSELAEGHFLHPRNVVSEGDHVRARILSIDGRSRRLGLSLRLL